MITAKDAHDLALDARDEQAEREANNIGHAIKTEAESKHFDMIWTFNSKIDDIHRIIKILEGHNFKVAAMPNINSNPACVEKDYKISWQDEMA